MYRDQLAKARIRFTTPNSESVRYDYHAFVSYSHAADARLAPTLQRCLQRLAKRWYRPRALRVFLDRANLAADPDIWATITTTLQRSRYFILMASPEAAASPWVRREVEYWQKRREQDTFLIALTDGVIVWDHAAADVDWERTSALPPQLRDWFDNEPLWVDLSWARSESQLSIRHAKFRDAVATLAAAIHEVPKDELDSEDTRQHRLATRLRWMAVTSLAVLTVISLMLALIAWRQTNQKQAALEQVQSALRQAVSHAVSLQSQAVGDTDPVVSKRLSVAAWRLDPSNAARAGMISAFNRPGNAVLPHRGGPVVLTSDGTKLVTASKGSRTGDLTVARRDPKNGRSLSDPVTVDGLSPMALSNDGRILVVRGQDEVRLLDTTTSQQQGASLAIVNVVGSLVFSPDGRMLAAGSTDRSVRLWDVATGTQIGRPLAGVGDPLTGVAFSPDGTKLATATGDFSHGIVRLWDVATHKQIGNPITGHAGAVQSVAFSPDGTKLATASYDKTVRLWDVATHRQIGSPFTDPNSPVSSVAFSPNGTMLAVGSDKTVRLWDVSTANGGQLGESFTGHTGSVEWVAFSPDGRTLVSSSGHFDATVRLWDITTPWQIGETLTSQPGDVISMAFSPDGTVLATGSANTDKAVRLWDIRTLRQIGDPLGHTGSALSLTFSPDNRILAVGGSDSTQLWDVATRVQIADPLPRINPPMGDFHSIAFDPNGRTLAIGKGATLMLWDITARVQVGRPITHNSPTGYIESVAFSPDGTKLATGSGDGTVRLWDVGTHRQIGDPLTGHAGGVRSVAFNSDGTILATDSPDDDTTRLWDVTTRAQIGGPFASHAGAGSSVAFNSDVTMLAAGDGDKVRLWEMPPIARVDAALCARVGSLTPAQWASHIPDLPYQQICQ